MSLFRKLLTLMFVLFVGTCCAPAATTKASQIDRFIDSVRKLNEPPDPAPDEVPPELAYKHKVAKMTLYGSVSSISVIMWNAAIEKAEKDGFRAMLIEINSGGGSTEEGFKTAKVIENSKMQIVCVVDGTAASEAFYILQSCDRRLMTKRSRLMIHEPYWLKLENVTRKQLKTSENELDVFVNSWMEHATGRMNMKPKEVVKRCTAEGGDWWLGWETALHFGAVDGVVRSTPAVWQTLSEKMSVEAITGP